MSTVQVQVGSGPAVNAVVSGTTWTATLTAPATVGNFNVTATATNAYGTDTDSRMFQAVVSPSVVSACLLTQPAAGITANTGTLNPAPPVTTPSGSGTAKTANSNATIVSQLATLVPGDVLTIQNGSYSGTFNVVGNGTATNPITIFVQGGVTFTGSTTFNIGTSPTQGSYIVFCSTGDGQSASSGALWSNTNDRCINLSYAKNSRVTGFRFINNGSGADGSATSMVYSQNITYTPVSWQTGLSTGNLPAPIYTQNNTVDHNYFSGVKNTPYGQGHGCAGNKILRNTFNDHQMGSGVSSTCVKLGYGVGVDVTNCVIAYNTVLAWSGNEYCVGFKSSGCSFIGNYMAQGKFAVRSGHNSIVTGNVMLDGAMQFEGGYNTVQGNWVELVNSIYGYGPLFLSTRVAHNFGIPYDPVSFPYYFYDEVRDSVFQDNVFISKTNDFTGVMTMYGYNSGTPGASGEEIYWTAASGGIRNNQFINNRFARTVMGSNGAATSWISARAVSPWPQPSVSIIAGNGNVWQDNVFDGMSPMTDGSVQVPAGIVGVGGNTIGCAGN